MSARQGLALALASIAAAGCVDHAPVPVTDNLAAPLSLFRPVCDRFDYPGAAPGSHWDGRAQLTWEALDTDVVVGVQCSLTSWRTGVPETLEARIDIRVPSARELRAFLAQNGIAVLPTVSP